MDRGIFIITLILSYLAGCSGIWKRFDLCRWGDKRGCSSNKPWSKITSNDGGGPPLARGAQFGSAVANMGDLDGDGIEDIMVGAMGENVYNSTGGLISTAGSAYVLFMTEEGTVKNYTHLTQTSQGQSSPGMPQLYYKDRFGYSIANIGDIDGDGINDVLVGAPGDVTAVTFVLFMQADGHPRDYMTIRGYYNPKEPTSMPTRMPIGSDDGDDSLGVPTGQPTSGPTLANPNPYTINPRDLRMVYRMNFGVSVAGIGDKRVAISTYPPDTASSVFIFRLDAAAIVQSWTELKSETYNGLSVPTGFLFGSSVTTIGDINLDGTVDLAIGAKYGSDSAGDGRKEAGVVFIAQMNADDTVQKMTMVSANSEAGNKEVENAVIPLKKYDFCASSIISVGDINKDDYASQRPHLTREKAGLDERQSVEDIIMGCPQFDSSGHVPGGGGRLFVVFLDEHGGHKGYRELPHPKRDIPKKNEAGNKRYDTAPKLKSRDSFGRSLARYGDMDNNGLFDLIVGAPGDDDGEVDSGAVYILYLRRRRWHSFVSDHFMYLFSIFFPISFCCCCCFLSCVYFFWYYRRKPDLVELAVKSSNIEIGKKRERKRQKIVIASAEDEYPG